jgi:hypothetical protein
MTRDKEMNGDNESQAEGPEQAYLEIDALLDGEPVDTRALRSALGDSAAREYLVEALVLRQMTRELEPTHFAIPGTPRGALVRGMRWLAAGVILAVGTGAGYLYGQASRVRTPPPSAVEVVIGNSPAPPAPEPTRSIRFEPGVNWTSGARSH